MEEQSKAIEQLRIDIKEKIERSLDTPADFDYLSKQIQDMLHEYVSPTTLKRFFNYIPSEVVPRVSTLTVLARFIGAAGWKDYCCDLNSDKDCQSAFISRKCVKSSDLIAGNKVEIAWSPNRRCTFEYLGDNQYIIKSSFNAKIKEEDTFITNQFLLEHPLYLNYLKRAENPNEITSYVAGYKTGIIYLSVID